MRSRVRTAAGVIVALTATAAAFGLPYSLASEYGGGLGSAVSGYALIVVIAGPVIALGAWLISRRGAWAPAAETTPPPTESGTAAKALPPPTGSGTAVETTPPPTESGTAAGAMPPPTGSRTAAKALPPPTASRTFRRRGSVLAAGLGLSLAAAGTGGVLGQAAHDRARLARDTACTPGDRAEFQALGAIQTNGDFGTGDSDGSCHASFGGRTGMALDELRRVAQGRGWRPEGADVYARDGMRLRIEVTDEGGKGLDITLRMI